MDLPTLSACLIVRDEAAHLADCVASVAGLVDEVVVCDTGSSDDTVRIAQDAGARVAHTTWTDDFAAARTAALTACRTEWVLSLDADERVTGDAGRLRAELDDTADALEVQIHNAGGADARGLATHAEVKLFRRERAAWTGRVHERLVSSIGQNLRVRAVNGDFRIVHHGYLDPNVCEAKAARNARLSSIALNELIEARATADEVARVALDLGRSQVACGQHHEAAIHLQLARDHAKTGPIYQWATDFLIRLAIHESRADDAHKLIGELADTAAPADYCRWLTALTLLQTGEPATALQLLVGIDRLTDLGGNQIELTEVLAQLSA